MFDVLIISPSTAFLLNAVDLDWPIGPSVKIRTKILVDTLQQESSRVGDVGFEGCHPDHVPKDRAIPVTQVVNLARFNTSGDRGLLHPEHCGANGSMTARSDIRGTNAGAILPISRHPNRTGLTSLRKADVFANLTSRSNTRAKLRAKGQTPIALASPTQPVPYIVYHHPPSFSTNWTWETTRETGQLPQHCKARRRLLHLIMFFHSHTPTCLDKSSTVRACPSATRI